MEPQDVTFDDVQKYREEIKYFYHMRKVFLGIGWGCIGIGITLGISLAAASKGNDTLMQFAIYLASFSIVAGLVCFVLRGALYNRRIKNRKMLIRQATQYQQERDLFGRDN